tara:strand:- start:1900 stop:4125 length:2226 start_codon:yes stop_codon:yes gene_type:complete
MGTLLNFIIKASIYLTVFLVPLVFSPFTFEAFEFTKQYLLLFLVFLGVFAWFLKMVLAKGEIRIRRTPLDLPILLFLGITILSGVFSVDKWSSVFGYYGRFSDSLLLVVGFVLLYFLLVNTIEKPQKLMRWFLGAVGIAIVVNYLSLFSVWQKLSFLPAIVRQPGFNPVAATMEGFSVFLGAITVFLVFQAVSPRIRQLPRVWPLLFIIASLGLLLLADVPKAWAVLFLGLLVVLGGSLIQRIRRKERLSIKRLWLPLSLSLLSLLFLFSPIKIPETSLQVPTEPMLSSSMSWSIARETVAEQGKNLILGSGQGTYAVDFSKHKPAEFNQLSFWQTRFDRAGNHFVEILATTGIFGFFSFLLIVLLFFLLSWFLFWAGKSSLFSIGVVALAISQLVYYQTTALGLAFWLLLGLSVVAWEKRPSSEFFFSLKRFPEFKVLSKALLLVVAGLFLGTLFFGARFYLADMKYLQAQIGDPALRIENAQKAVQLNPYQAEYKMFLSRLYLQRALAELQKPEEERDQVLVSSDVQRAIAHVRGDRVGEERITGATELSPNRVAAWETLGAVYRDIKSAPGALNWAIRSFETAIILEPTNPVLHTELGKLYAEKEQYIKARTQLEKAIEVKPDYVEASRENALVFEKEGDVGKAIAEMRDLTVRYSLDLEALFQLGRLYYNNGQIAEAVSQFQQVLLAAPNHSNARFALGVAFQEQGKTEEAAREFERVGELNPENEAVQKKLQELQK